MTMIPDEWTRVFFPCKYFQPDRSKNIRNKLEYLPLESLSSLVELGLSLSDAPLQGMLLGLPQALDLAGKPSKDQTLIRTRS